jgi:EAL domain-containing protein (putative c-di-GMP-specific phosphodiesterase class I)
LRVIVEGIETGGQADLCRQYGADVLQGFFLSRPISQDDFESRFGIQGPCGDPVA